MSASPAFLIAWANLRMFESPDGLVSMPEAHYHQMDVALACDGCGRLGLAYALDPDQDAPAGFLARPCPTCRESPAGGNIVPTGERALTGADTLTRTPSVRRTRG